MDNAPKSPISAQQNSSKKDDNDDISNTKVKSDNANLKSISLSTGNIEFDKDKTEYNLEVENETDKIIIEATKDDESSSVKGLGEYELKVGLNDIKITVTAEDGSIKEYILKITRKNLESIVEIESVNYGNGKKEKNTESNNLKISLIVLVICILFAIMLFALNKHNKIKSNKNSMKK